ncbi:RidA family protein [Streptomyces chromofuscus]|uniref:RidA family protein n=1 Tax=Streptomyces chromofuscus TaxID=42881 RepID=A0A7M2T5H1_STRCW|nr:RidA family protein [Streptomyces chromofuscus]QOV43930.1 RidA family protein [Streptomyces chromofuscus]GGT20610.1 enamine deaminase RidA [Streptomyces chromofuscus]
MSEPTRITAPDGVAAATQYAHVVMGTGRFVAVAGQLPLDERGELVGAGDPAAQARQVFENLRRCLAAAGGTSHALCGSGGATFDDVVKLTYFVTDMAHMSAVRAARAERIPDDRLPAASAVQVAGLVRPEYLMEIEAHPLPKGVGAPPAVVAA